MKVITAQLLMLIATFSPIALGQTTADRSDESLAVSAPPLIDPIFLLVRDSGVRRRLALKDKQRKELDGILDKHNRLLLAMRDVGPQGVPEEAKPKVANVRSAVEGVLNEAQRDMLEGLIMQAQGYDALLRPDVTSDLKLSIEQTQRLKAINDNFQSQALKLQSSSEQNDAQRRDALLQARREQQQGVLAVLSDQQKQRWGKQLGARFDFTALRTGPAKAPDFDGASSWINTAPLSLEKLRGKVVIVHFMAFGCINCIHNYPWYREWQEAYDPAEVTIIGIHTPETKTEHDVEKLKSKLEENDLRFPVAVDNDKKLWEAWSNSIWPSVYLIDKQGVVRYWWYGELDWQGRGAQRQARQRIDELQAESSNK